VHGVGLFAVENLKTGKVILLSGGVVGDLALAADLVLDRAGQGRAPDKKVLAAFAVKEQRVARPCTDITSKVNARRQGVAFAVDLAVGSLMTGTGRGARVAV